MLSPESVDGLTPHQLWMYQRGCISKVPFHNATRAAKALRDMKRVHPIDTPDLVIYKCRFCNRYHLGNDTLKARWTE